MGKVVRGPIILAAFVVFLRLLKKKPKKGLTEIFWRINYVTHVGDEVRDKDVFFSVFGFYKFFIKILFCS